MKFRVLIIDDELPARKLLRRLLEEHADFECVGEATSASEAMNLIERIKPDLLLLDIQMPQRDGFQMLRELKNPPLVIFVTAHAMHAAEAFEVEAVDYVLKPVTSERLTKALERFRRDVTAPNGKEGLVLTDHRGMRPVQISEILYVQADGNYSTFHFTDNTLSTVYGTLTEWENRLPTETFQRLDRSLLINQKHVDRLVVKGRTGGQISFRFPVKPIPLGRTAAVRMKAVLKERTP